MWVRRTAVSATAEGVAHVRRCSSLARVVYERFALYSESRAECSDIANLRPAPPANIHVFRAEEGWGHLDLVY